MNPTSAINLLLLLAFIASVTQATMSFFELFKRTPWRMISFLYVVDTTILIAAALSQPALNWTVATQLFMAAILIVFVKIANDRANAQHLAEHADDNESASGIITVNMN